jgi:hypothetical protein
LKPHNKKWVTATLVALCLMTITDMIYIYILLNIKGLSIKGEEQSYSKETIDANMAYITPVVIARYVLYALALVFLASSLSVVAGCGAL